ncbi:MAG TPA: molybdopterin-dependent oxidoreductase [Candidatus Limnocylindrales bacterium]|nr:molybdopterin-dependent oxidoreductase [Candidatus Limnocylindrales bacterium]
MQVFKRYKRPFLVVGWLIIILLASSLAVQCVSERSTMRMLSLISSPLPTEILSASTPIQTPSGAASTLSLYPEEVTRYQNQSLTPISDFIGEFVATSINGTPSINQSTYRLTITGLVNQTVSYTYADVVKNFQAHEEVVRIICVEGWSATVLWQGVSVSDLLQNTGVSPKANTLIFYAADGYSTSLPLSYVEQNNIIIAYKMNNVTLPTEAGFPFILVAQNQYGYKWIKWLTEIDVSNNSGYLGYWESRGYPNNATVSSPTVGPLNFVITLEILGFSAVAIIVGVAVYLILVKPKKRIQQTEEKI